MSASIDTAGLYAALLPEPKPAAPVSMKGRMTDNGYQPENHQWLDLLLERNEHGKAVGRNPMDLPLDVLKSAGHPPRRTAALVAAWSDRGDEPLFAPIKEVRDIRDHCLGCSAGEQREVRECRIINCPFWAFRTGRNPHNPKRGTRPLFGSKLSATAEFGEQDAPDWGFVSPGARTHPGADLMSAPNLLSWRRVFGTRGVHSSICALGVFRTMASGRRVIITLNDVVIGNHGDLAKARAQADRLIEATAEYFLAKKARVDPGLIPADLTPIEPQNPLRHSVPQSSPANPLPAAESIAEPTTG